MNKTAMQIKTLSCFCT